MKRHILLLFVLASTLCQAQTKVIAHKSHGGSAKTFSKAYQKKAADMSMSNFGLPGKVTIIVLDTVVALNDSVTMLKMRASAVCYPYGTSYTDLKESDFDTRIDTLVGDAVFTRKNTIAFIKKSRGNYPIWFVNPVEEVVFIGFKEE